MTNETITKKNLKPQQTEPVQREINTTSSECHTGLNPLYERWSTDLDPFAGDDAE